MTMPKISIILVYKNSRNLKDSIESIIQQPFTNIEAVCVNNGSKDGAEKIVQKLAAGIDRIKQISLPEGLENDAAARAGLAVSEGEFVIFIYNNEILPMNFIKDKYLEMHRQQTSLKQKHLYRRAFLENDAETAAIISEAAEKEAVKQQQKLDKEFDAFQKHTAENIKNSTYELVSRFNYLEKQFYDKDRQLFERVNSMENAVKASFDERLSNIYADMQKIYDYINAEINIKGSEISRVYDEISKNYKYTEELVQKSSKTQEGSSDIEERLSGLEKEIILRYQNLKRIMDIQLDEINQKLNGG